MREEEKDASTPSPPNPGTATAWSKVAKAIASAVCPKCGSTVCRFRGPHNFEDKLIQYGICRSCGQAWESVYELEVVRFMAATGEVERGQVEEYSEEFRKGE